MHNINLMIRSNKSKSKKEWSNEKIRDFYDALDNIHENYESDIIVAINDPTISRDHLNSKIDGFQQVIKAIEVVKKFNPVNR